ncbi:MAG TPA: hypothetical protein DIU18_00260 [Gemmatimonadetes bacterium]|nr:hypothetical protein [Gemmatimonadota bacterium]
MDELVIPVDSKKMDVGDAEEHVSRLDTLLNYIQVSLESVRSQNAMVNAVLKKTGQLIWPAHAPWQKGRASGGGCSPAVSVPVL